MDNHNRVLRLVKSGRKGLLHLIFSRFFVVLILLIMQIVMVFSLYGWIAKLLPYYTAVGITLTFLAVVYLFSREMNSASKLTWMFFISIMPLTGAFLLVFTQTHFGYRRLRSKVSRLIAYTSDTIEQSERVREKLSGDPSGTDDLGRYLNRSGCFPIYDNTSSRFFPIGEDMFEAILEELEKAQKFIFLEFFIIEEGYMWGSILKILDEKAKAGVDVRVMYDGLLEISTLPSNYCRLLAEHGIKAKMFSPLLPVVSSHYNFRDHRKIIVIDGKTAFTGGVNLADEYINQKLRFGHWKDTGIQIKGEAVRSFTLMFLQMWNIDEQSPVFEPWVSITPSEEVPSDGFVIPYGDCPMDGERVGEMVYMDIFYRAVDYVYVMTPYLILDGELETAILYAAERGVDIRLILPGIPDKKYAYALAKAHYKKLVKAGVKIYEYTPGFVHAKVFVSDDCKAVVGTINLDYRSLYHHYECAAYLYRTSCIPDIKKDFLETLTKCREVTPETIRNEKISYKVLGWLMKLIAPML